MSSPAIEVWTPMPDMFEIRCPLPAEYAGDYDIAESGEDEQAMRLKLAGFRTAGCGGPYSLHRIRSVEQVVEG